jgi:hypothetical protein
MEEAADPRSRVATFLERSGEDLNLTLPPVSDDRVAKTADHRGDKLA